MGQEKGSKSSGDKKKRDPKERNVKSSIKKPEEKRRGRSKERRLRDSSSSSSSSVTSDTDSYKRKQQGFTSRVQSVNGSKQLAAKEGNQSKDQKRDSRYDRHKREYGKSYEKNRSSSGRSDSRSSDDSQINERVKQSKYVSSKRVHQESVSETQGRSERRNYSKLSSPDKSNREALHRRGGKKREFSEISSGREKLNQKYLDDRSISVSKTDSPVKLAGHGDRFKSNKFVRAKFADHDKKKHRGDDRSSDSSHSSTSSNSSDDSEKKDPKQITRKVSISKGSRHSTDFSKKPLKIEVKILKKNLASTDRVDERIIHIEEKEKLKNKDVASSSSLCENKEIIREESAEHITEEPKDKSFDRAEVESAIPLYAIDSPRENVPKPNDEMHQKEIPDLSLANDTQISVQNQSPTRLMREASKSSPKNEVKPKTKESTYEYKKPYDLKEKDSGKKKEHSESLSGSYSSASEDSSSNVAVTTRKEKDGKKVVRRGLTERSNKDQLLRKKPKRKRSKSSSTSSSSSRSRSASSSSSSGSSSKSSSSVTSDVSIPSVDNGSSSSSSSISAPKRREKEKERGRQHSKSPHKHRRKRSSTPRPRKIHVGHLSRNIKKTHLHEIFGHFGLVKNVDLPADRLHPHESRGFAYIEFESADDAENAISHMNTGQIDGQEVYVKPVLQYRQRPPLPRPSPTVRRPFVPWRRSPYRGRGAMGGKGDRYRARRSPYRPRSTRRRTRSRSPIPRRRIHHRSSSSSR